MSNRPRLLKKQSSLAILVQLERETCESASRPPSEGDQSSEEDSEQLEIEEDARDLDENPASEDMLPGEHDPNEDNEFVDYDGGDTDATVSSGDETEPEAISPASSRKSLSISRSVSNGGEAHASLPTDDITPPPRTSRRLMSMKRRGKFFPVVELTEEFEFHAFDVLTVRGEDKDFYVCRVLEDVIESADNFRVAWFNRLAENLYEVSI